MSKLKDELIKILAEHFWSYKEYELKDVLKEYGLFPDETLDPYNSKRKYAKSALIKLSENKLIDLSKRIAVEQEDTSLNRQLGKYLNDSMFEFTYITRKKLAEYLDTYSDFEGSMQLDEFLNDVWDMNKVYTYSGDEMFSFNSVSIGHYIMTFVVADQCISYKEMLLDILKIKYISDNLLIKFLEKIVDPEVRSGTSQKEYVDGINSIIESDGFELVESGRKSKELIYKIQKKRGTNDKIKNLIFAPLSKKPDIVIEDSLSNEIKIVGDTGDCLLYNFKPYTDGVLWGDLVEWWGKNTEAKNIQNDLYCRLAKSLDSDAEKIFFKQYYMLYREKDKFPALIPQVYLHYDPYTKIARGNNIIFTHQRMDFLMLLPNSIRIIIEIDGKQHYSEGGEPSPKLYAQMVTDTRELQLKGYEVYRFGGYEFKEDENPKKRIQKFFEDLFSKYPL